MNVSVLRLHYLIATIALVALGCAPSAGNPAEDAPATNSTPGQTYTGLMVAQGNWASEPLPPGSNLQERLEELARRRGVPLNVLTQQALAQWSNAMSGAAQESAEALLRNAEDVLLKAHSFSLDYTAGLGGSGWPGIMLQGELAYQSNGRYFLTNAGAIVIHPAALTLVSDGENFLEIHPKGVEWVPGRTGPLTRKETVPLLVRGGIGGLVGWVTMDALRKSTPQPDDKPIAPLSASTNLITEMQLVGQEPVPGGGRAYHLKFKIDYGTPNGAEPVELWLDTKSGLPIKRTSVPPKWGSALTESYSFTLNPKLAPSRFDPRQVARAMKVEGRLAAAEKPDARLLTGALWADEGLVRDALKAGANANARTPLGGRPGPNLSALMLAAISGNQRSVERLVEAGAEVNAQAPSGATPFSFAELYHHAEIADWLKEHGAKAKPSGN